MVCFGMMYTLQGCTVSVCVFFSLGNVFHRQVTNNVSVNKRVASYHV